MNPQDPLAALQPLRTPDPVAWWPPAPGWWFLLLLALLLVGLAALWLWRRYRKNAYRRAAARQMDLLLLAYREDGDQLRYLQRVNALLKSVALQAWPAASVAAMSGQDWLDFLNRELRGGATFDPALAGAHYRPGASLADPEALAPVAKRWIRSHRSPS